MFLFTDEELLKPVQLSLEKVRPVLKRDKGDLELLKIKDGVVYISLVGACHGCKHSSSTLENIILMQLKNDIHQDIKLQNIDKNDALSL